MNRLQVLLSVLLALLLPVQGAVAAAMLCPHEMATDHGHDHSHAEHATMNHGEMRAVQIVQGHHHTRAGQHAVKCGLCAACCSGAALASVWPTGFDFRLSAAGTFSVAPLPATSFLSDGQERPPRSF